MAESTPAHKSHPVRRWLLGAAVCVSVFLIPIRFDTNNEFWERLMDAAHIPFVAILTFFAWRILPARIVRNRALLAFAICTAAAGLSEWLQSLTGREPSWSDFTNSAAGAFLVFLGITMWQRRPVLPWRLIYIAYAGALCAITVLPAWREFRAIAFRSASFPVLGDFENPHELRLWCGDGRRDAPDGARIRRDTAHPSHGASSLRIETRAHGHPGVRFLAGDQDWRSHAALAFDVFNPADPFELSLRIDDDFPKPARDDRYNRALPIAPGWNHIVLPLDEIARTPKNRALNLTAIRRVVFFLDDPAQPRVFHLDHVRLDTK